MKGTVYWRKWTRMPWWSRLFHVNNLDYSERFNDQWAMLGPTIDFVDQTFKDWEKVNRPMHRLTQDHPEIKLTKHEKIKHDFVKRIFDNFPQLAVLSTDENPIQKNQDNKQKLKIINSLVHKFSKYIRQGFSAENSTQKTINQFKSSVNLAISELSTTEILAQNLNSTSLIDFLTLEKIRESDLKTKRVKRDEDLLKVLKEGKLEYDDDYEPNYSVLNKNAFDSINETKNQTYDQILTPETIKNEKNELADFINRSQNLMWKYFDQTLRKDKIAGMSNEDVISLVFYTPTTLERMFKPYIKMLDHYKVKLSPIGTLFLNDVIDEGIRRKLEKKKNIITYALMLRDLHFGHQHQQLIAQKAVNLQNKIAQINKETSEKFRIENEENLRELTDKLKLNKSAVDDLVGFMYYEQPKREKQIVRDPLSKQNMNIDNFLKGHNDRIDWKNDFKDSIFERNLKLEADWLKHQTLLQTTSHETRLKLIQRMADTIKTMRRVRFQFDKNAIKKASKLFFMEHLGVNFEEEEIEIERLDDYFKIPNEIFVKDPREDYEYQKSKKAIKKTLLPLDLDDPLKTGTHDVLEIDHAETNFWEDQKILPKKGFDFMDDKANSSEIDPLLYKGLQMTRLELDKYKKDNNITDISTDPLLQLMQTRWELKKVKIAEKLASKKNKKKKTK